MKKKMLLISIPSIHAIRWIENLKYSGYELYWFDILDRGSVEELNFLTQIVGWKKRKIKYLKGEYFLRKNIPAIYNVLEPFFQVTISEKFEEVLNIIKPDLVHSFEMQSCSYPILNTMIKYKDIPWLYSCWGSDLYYYRNYKNHLPKLKSVLNRVSFLHTDCYRDYQLAKDLGFKGRYLGVIPGGTGFKLSEFEKFKLPLEERNIILIKGYDHKFGRAINVLKALSLLSNELLEFEIVIFGAHQKVIDYLHNNQLHFKVFKRNELSHLETIKLMGKSKIYIGNSISDGMPNTLLEAIIMNAFPIQSNPGGATAEIIEDGLNGLLIQNPVDVSEIKLLIQKALQFNKDGKFLNAAEINTEITKERLDYLINKKKVLDLYHNINSCE